MCIWWFEMIFLGNRTATGKAILYLWVTVLLPGGTGAGPGPRGGQGPRSQSREDSWTGEATSRSPLVTPRLSRGQPAVERG